MAAGAVAPSGSGPSARLVNRRLTSAPASDPYSLPAAKLAVAVMMAMARGHVRADRPGHMRSLVGAIPDTGSPPALRTPARPPRPTTCRRSGAARPAAGKPARPCTRQAASGLNRRGRSTWRGRQRRPLPRTAGNVPPKPLQRRGLAQTFILRVTVAQNTMAPRMRMGDAVTSFYPSERTRHELDDALVVVAPICRPVGGGRSWKSRADGAQQGCAHPGRTGRGANG